MKCSLVAALALAMVGTAPLQGQAGARRQVIESRPRLDSVVDEMSGATTFAVWASSPDTVTWRYGRLSAVLGARCQAGEEPVWLVGAAAPPDWEPGSSPAKVVPIELRTDSTYLPRLDAYAMETGEYHWLLIRDTLFSRYIESSQAIRLRWPIITNERVMFSFPVASAVQPHRQLRQRCMGDLAFQRALLDSLRGVCELTARGDMKRRLGVATSRVDTIVANSLGRSSLQECDSAAGRGIRALRVHLEQRR